MNPGEHENPEIPVSSSNGNTPPSASDGNPPPSAPSGRIQWGLFFRAASPLAVVTGVISSMLPPVGLLLVLPLSLNRIIARYRPFHSGPLRASHGARLGAFMALLSFAAFLVFFLATLSLYRPAMLEKVHEYAAQSPDPQSQQVAEWFATGTGFAALVAFTLVFFLATFLVAGAVSGALLTRPRKPSLTP